MSRARRPRGSGYKSQAAILRFLIQGGPKCFQEIVDGTGLHRNTVASNLKILVEVDYVRKERQGRKVMYSAVDDERELADIRRFFLEKYATKEAFDEAQKVFIEDAKQESRITLYWFREAKKYRNEIAELTELIPGLDTLQLHEVFSIAKEWRRIKQEQKRTRISLPSEETKRIEGKRSRVQDLLDFKKRHPGAIEIYKLLTTLKKKHRFQIPAGFPLIYPADDEDR